MNDDLYPSPDSPYASLSPSYIMDLAAKVERHIGERFESSDDARRYLEHWHRGEGWNDQNFEIVYEFEVANVAETLHGMHPELLVRIAMDLGVDTPGMLPSIPKFRNTLKDQSPYALASFDRAVRSVIDEPEEAVRAASSTLESLLKTIANDENLGIKESADGQVCARLLNTVLDGLEMKSGLQVPPEIRTIAKRLQGIGDSVFDLRSNKTLAHGPEPDAYVIDDPVWSELVVNATATLGMFLWEFYSKTKRIAESTQEAPDFGDIPF